MKTNKGSSLAGLLAVVTLIFGLAGCEQPTNSPKPVTYKVSFDLNGGNISGDTANPADQLIVKGGKVSNPGDAVKAGHTFSGWFNGEVKWDFAASTVSAGITLKAEWDKITYTVTFNSDGGSEVARQTIVENGKAEKPGDPAKDSFVFGGWYKEETFANLWDFDNDTVTANITLYARWGIPALSGSIHIAGGIKGAIISQADTGDTLYAVYSGKETVSYQWKNGDVDIPGATAANYQPSEAGSYTVTVSATGYTGKTSAPVEVTGDTLSQDDLWKIADFGKSAAVTRTIEVPDSVSAANLKSVLEALGAGNYIVNVTGEVALSSVIELKTSGVTISLRGAGDDAKLVNQNGSIFSLEKGAFLILRDITLQGSGTAYGVVSIKENAELVMESGSAVSGGKMGVRVADGGNFYMKGGEIYGATEQGGVTVYGNVWFIKTGGTIYGYHAGPEKSNEWSYSPLSGYSAVTVMNSMATSVLLYRDDDVRDDLSLTIDADDIKDKSGNWQMPRSYMVSFDLDGGNIGGNPANPANQTIIHGSKVTKPGDPTKRDYVFTGWYNGQDKWYFMQSTVTADMTLKAGWAALYSITFNLNSGSFVDNNLPTDYTIETATITLPAPVRDEYTFCGWYDNVGLTGAAVTAIPQGSTGHKEFWAGWKAIALYNNTTPLSGTTHTFNDLTALTVKVTNTGNMPTGALTAALSEAGASSFTLSANSIGSIAVGGSDTTTLTITPNDNTFGRNTATVTVSGGSAPNVFEATFTVSRNTTAITPVNLASYLAQASIPTGAAGTPTTVTFTSGNLSDATNGWGSVNTIVSSAQKYVALDLSACSFSNNRIEGSAFYPSGNSMNVIKYNQYIKSIILPTSLITIGNDAFRDCNYLTSVTIGPNVTSIGSGFVFCPNLTSVNIPSGVTSLGDWAFGACDSLTGIVLPNTLIEIGQNAFAGIPQTSIIIPASVTTIKNNAFENSHLTSVTFESGSNITTWGTNTFPEGSNNDGGDTLKDAYNAQDGGPGTYTRTEGDSNWAKQ